VRSRCKDCEREYLRKLYHTPWGRYLKSEYKISPKQFDNMVKIQNGGCAICDVKLGNKLYIDHNHKTGKIRGLLCNTCNRAIGLLKHDTEILKRAQLYLEENLENSIV